MLRRKRPLHITGWGMMPIFLFPSPSPSDPAGSPWRWAQELAKPPKRNHFPLSPCSTLPCWIIVEHFCICFPSLSLFGQVPDTHSPLCFLPWHAEEVKTAEKGLLLTCHWVFLSSFLEQIKLLNEEPCFGKAKYSVVSGLALNSHMFPGYNSLFLLVWDAFQSPFHPAEEQKWVCSQMCIKDSAIA